MLAMLSLGIGAMIAVPAASGDEVVQRAVINESFGYINLSERGGRPTGPWIDNDGPPPLQVASMTAEFSNFHLNGISFTGWQTCRSSQEMPSVDECLEQLVEEKEASPARGFVTCILARSAVMCSASM